MNLVSHHTHCGVISGDTLTHVTYIASPSDIEHGTGQEMNSRHAAFLLTGAESPLELNHTGINKTTSTGESLSSARRGVRHQLSLIH